MYRILVVEDENNIGEFIELNLKNIGYNPVRVSSGEKAKELIDNGEKFDLALLDVMLPGINGVSLCEYIRRNNNEIGIIMLSAKSQEQDKVAALSVGADDYITKPFGTSELQARISALLRRIIKKETKIDETEDLLKSGIFSLDLKSRILKKNDEIIDLTSVEFSIMELFFKEEGVALIREKILEGAWGENYFGDLKIVDVNIRRLRMKIEEDPSNPQYIITVWGYGYRWSV